METFSPQIVVAFTTAILTAIVTLVSIHLSHRSQSKMEEAKFLREKDTANQNFRKDKTEELYTLFSCWKSDTSTLYATFIPVIKNEMSEIDAFKIANKNQMSNRGSWQRINMLVNLYFPSLLIKLEPVMEARNNASNYLKGNVRGSKNLDKFIVRQEEFDMATTQFLKEISHCAVAL